MNRVISFSLVTKHVVQMYRVCEFYRKFSCIRCMYHLIHLSVRLSTFYRKFSCIGHTYHLIYQVWGFLLSTGNFHALDVCTISSTKCGASAFCRNFSCIGRTYHFIHQVWGFPLFAENFRASDVHTISSTKCGAFHFLQEIFVNTTYVRTMAN